MLKAVLQELNPRTSNDNTNKKGKRDIESLNASNQGQGSFVAEMSSRPLSEGGKLKAPIHHAKSPVEIQTAINTKINKIPTCGGCEEPAYGIMVKCKSCKKQYHLACIQDDVGSVAGTKHLVCRNCSKQTVQNKQTAGLTAGVTVGVENQ